MILDIEKAFNTSGHSIFDFYQRPGVGFYIPLYQREYSWDIDNIEQLLDDITKGVSNIIEDPDEIRFLGTIITVVEVNKQLVQPQDIQGLPTSIEKVIDGQQRITTIALLSTLLYEYIDIFQKKLMKVQDLKAEIEEICEGWKTKLLQVISLDLARGSIRHKPIIIRGNVDKWTKDGAIDTNYISMESKYLAEYIESIFVEEKKRPKPYTECQSGRNLKRIEKWIKEELISAHDENGHEYASANEIISNVAQENIWQYERENLFELVNYDGDEPEKLKVNDNLCSLVQLITAAHYLLDRCCFTLIQPTNDDWAFDMFQSLNASGTPLTAIETFKPLVVNVTNETGHGYKDSSAEKSFNFIESLFVKSKNAAQKTKLTNDFLASFRIVVDGKKLASHFSQQRKWLVKIYQEFDEYDRKKDYIVFMGRYAKFFSDIWMNYEAENNQVIHEIVGGKDAELASLLFLFLKDSNHKMAATMLGAYYKKLYDGEENSIDGFIERMKIVSAFYILWRSAQGNSGLDNAYRKFFEGIDRKVKDGVEIEPAFEPQCWLENGISDNDILKAYFARVLKKQGIDTKEKWVQKAKNFLSYSSAKSICRILLFIVAHDTIPDPDTKGLMKTGTPGSADFLRLERYKSKDLKTIEHIAPVNNSENFWDANLYGEDELYNSIGNLTLLPGDVNISAGNKGIKEKHMYYLHLNQTDPQKLQELANKASTEGIDLSKETIELLQASNYNSHIAHIITSLQDEIWDSNVVKNRTIRILQIAWDRISNWIFT